MQRLDIDDLYLFKTLQEELSLAGVASRLGVDKSSVTRRIQKIERLIGASVILRSDTIQLTEAGAQFLDLATNILTQYDLFQNKVDLIQSGKILIRIIGNAAMMGSDMPQAIQMVSELHPNAKFRIDTGTMAEIMESIRSGKADIGFTPDAPETAGLIFHKYRKERLVVLVSNDHALAKQSKVEFDDLTKYSLIGATEGRVITGVIEHQARLLGVDLNYLVTVSDYILQARFAAESNLGPAVMFESIAHKIRQGKILELDAPWAWRDIFICLPNVRERPTAIDKLVDTLLELNKNTYHATF